MSFFLLPQEQIHRSIFPDDQHERQSIQTEKKISSHSLLGDFVKNELKLMKECFLGHFKNKNGDERFLLKKMDLGFNLKALFTIKVSKKKYEFSFSVDVLGLSQNYYKAITVFQAIQICRNIIVQHSIFTQNLACLKMDLSKRQIKIYNWPTLKKSHKTNNIISLIVHMLIRPHLSPIDVSLRNVLIQDGGATAHDLMFQKPRKSIDLINNYSLLSNVATHIPCHLQNQQLFALRNIQNKKQSLENLNKHKTYLHQFFFKNSSLYSNKIGEDPNCEHLADYQQITKTQKLMKVKIAIQAHSYSDQPQHNYMIQNKIQLQNFKDLEMQKIKQGGFAHIFLAKIDFWYPCLSDGCTPNPKESSQVFSQVMVLKIDMPSTDMFQLQQQMIEKDRRQHELSIISKLRLGKSIYIPKYFFPTNLQKYKSNILNQSLLMEHIPYKTLGEILSQNSYYFSLHSKVSLMFSVCQGLRYLRDFDIVHLDLKPNNIMTYINPYIKLIDFGQSYHHQICGDSYQPGFTVPYSAPQIFSEKPKYFTSKTDVFSFGVILYQMIFNRIPFELSKSTCRVDEMMQHYLEYWFYSSEEGESYGDGKIIRILVGLISRCISLKACDRPQLDSIALVLKLILDVIN